MINFNLRLAASTVFIAFGLGGCAAPVPLAGSASEANASRAALACTLPSNCTGGGVYHADRI